MGRFVRKCLLFGAILTTLLAGITGFILFGLPPQFNGTYQHALYLQTRLPFPHAFPKSRCHGGFFRPIQLGLPAYEHTAEKAGSNAWDPFVTGVGYILALSKSSIHRGDIMVLELTPDGEDSFSPAIVLTACENHFDLYRGFTPDNWSKVIRYYPTYLIKKVKYYFHYRDEDPPSYSIHSFDRNGNYDYQRVGCLLPPHLQPDERDTVLNRNSFSNSLIQTLNDYDSYCARRGATFLVSFPPFLNESLVSSPSGFSSLQNYLSHRLKAPIITKISERDLPRRYFYDNVTHCNTQGAEKVTDDLAEDILHYSFGKTAPQVVTVKKSGKKSKTTFHRKSREILPKKTARLPRRL